MKKFFSFRIYDLISKKCYQWEPLNRVLEFLQQRETYSFDVVYFCIRVILNCGRNHYEKMTVSILT